MLYLVMFCLLKRCFVVVIVCLFMVCLFVYSFNVLHPFMSYKIAYNLLGLLIEAKGTFLQLKITFSEFLVYW